MAIKHFSYQHLLVLNEGIESQDDNNSGCEEVLCNACRRPIIKEGGSAYYSCSESDWCDFVMHKTCAELPKEIKYPSHPKHSLTLLAVSPYKSNSFICNICRSKSRGFTYNCSVCEFDVDVKCAFEDCYFRHQSHDHNLSLLQRPSTFHCDACGGVAEDLSYHCTICSFWIHKNCAFSPNTIKPTFHNHSLTLSYYFPEKYRTFRQYCYICKKRVNPSNWLYMCAACRIFTHIKCATSEPTVLRDGEIEIDPNLMVFPLMPEQSSLDLIRQFVERLNLEAADRIEAIRDEIHHWSHEDHPLILFENQSKDKNEMKVSSEKMLICDGCVKSINADGEEDPYYACLQCNFFLHKVCATFPREFRHNSFESEQPLQLLLKPRYDFDFIYCSECEIATNGFYLPSTDRFGHDDVICAALPNSIKHEAHAHPLVQNQVNSFDTDATCASCSIWIYSGEYRCEACDFRIHSRCTLLPRTIRHRWDPHPIPLVYPPIPDHPDLFYCEICEDEIDTTYWLYFCADCDQAFHIHCIRQIHEHSNVKFGSTHKFDGHPHSLTFLRKSANKYPSPCGKCGKSRDGEPVLECAPCNFLLCPRPCAIDLLSHSI